MARINSDWRQLQSERRLILVAHADSSALIGVGMTRIETGSWCPRFVRVLGSTNLRPSSQIFFAPFAASFAPFAVNSFFFARCVAHHNCIVPCNLPTTSDFPYTTKYLAAG
jgi:hypothetical protein